MIYIIIPLAMLGLSCAGIYPYFNDIAPKTKLIFKASASALFVLGASLLTGAYFGRFPTFILCAVILGAVGDVALALSPMDPKRAALWNVLGGVAFLGGHVLYLVLFFGMAKFNLWLLFILPFFAAVPLLFVKKLRTFLGKAAPFVSIYSTTVGLLVMSTLNLLIADPKALSAVLFIGGVLFASSDFTLMANNVTESPKAKKITSYVIAWTYYVAQWLFVIAIAINAHVKVF